MVNIFGVLVAAVAAFLLGFLWYGPLFGKTWMKLAGIKVKPKKNEMIYRSLGGLGTYLMMAFVLAMFLDYIKLVSFGHGLGVGFLVWLGFIGTISLGSFLWEKKPFKLWVLNNAYNLLSVLIMTGILMMVK